MIVKEISLRNWRSLGPTRLNLGEGISVISGNNGQGKTNFLEALFAVINFRSFRTNNLAEAIRWGQRSAELSAKLDVANLARQLDLKVELGSKLASLDGKATRRDSENLNVISAVVFSPEDLKLVKAPPSERRKFLDRIVFSGNRKYAKVAIEYNRGIKARNLLLRARRTGPLIESYDEILSRTGADILRERKGVTERLQKKVNQLFKELHSNLELTLSYKSKVLGECEDGQEVAYLKECLHRSVEKDLDRGFTTVGPHHDDLRIDLKGVDAEKHASQGQIRSIVLALKIAELQIIREKNEENPLFLMDDIASELDEEKRRKLVDVVKDLRCQCVISVTEKEQFPNAMSSADLKVDDGVIFTS